MDLPSEQAICKHCKNINTIMHLGAYMGEEINFYESIDVKTIIWVEANKYLFDKLVDNVNQKQKNTKNIAINRAIFNEDNKIIEFNLMSDSEQQNMGSSSILKPKKHLTIYPGIRVVETVKVKTITIDTISKKGIIVIDDINMINIDLQGAELIAFNGAINLLSNKNLKYILTEVSFDELYENVPLIEEIDIFLQKFNFKRVETIKYHKTWGDALYVKG